MEVLIYVVLELLFWGAQSGGAGRTRRADSSSAAGGGATVPGWMWAVVLIGLSALCGWILWRAL